MRIIFYVLTGILICSGLRAGELETRLHRFTYASPEQVERQIRVLVPEGPRVSMNPRANEVIVIADAETQARIDSMLKVLGRPPCHLKLTVTHNQKVLHFSPLDGVPISLPVSQTPPANLVAMARSRLAPEARDFPVVGSALQAQVNLLREDPAVIRMRVFPALIFGVLPPYEVVKFENLAMDIMVDTQHYVELHEQLKSHEFYSQFLMTQPDPGAPPRPVSLLVSFEGLEFKTAEKPNEKN